MHNILKKINRSLEKNLPDVKALLTGNMPCFVYKSEKTGRDHYEIPVFVFHNVVPEYLEKQFLYLTSNGYRTLNADELEKAVCSSEESERFIAITFDDATWSFWAYAFPLLQKYDLQAILFVCPGIISEDATVYPNLKDVWDGRCSSDDVSQRRKVQPLCTWRELMIMHKSGKVDIQSHSLTHSLVPVSKRLVDFYYPDFDAGFGNVRIPVSSLDDPASPERKLLPGAPLFKSTSRMASQCRFIENPELIKTMVHYVEQHGGNTFFNRSGWRKELKRIFRKWPSDRLGSFETSKEMESAVSRELVESKNLLEKRLLPKKIRHFCYPWFISSEFTDRLAVDAGYDALYYGVEGEYRKTERPVRIRRISEEYLFRLPGDGRQSLSSVWMEKARHLWNSRR